MVCLSSALTHFSSKAWILELLSKIPHKGQGVRDAVVCELSSPVGPWGFLSVIKNLSEHILVRSGCNTLHTDYTSKIQGV